VERGGLVAEESRGQAREEARWRVYLEVQEQLGRARRRRRRLLDDYRNLTRDVFLQLQVLQARALLSEQQDEALFTSLTRTYAQTEEDIRQPEVINFYRNFDRSLSTLRAAIPTPARVDDE
jgi:hypothetical protein